MYKSNRIIDGKPRWIIVDKNGKITNRNPSQDELRGLEKEEYESMKYKKLKKCCACGNEHTYTVPNGYDHWYICNCQKENCTGYRCKTCFYKYGSKSIDNKQKLSPYYKALRMTGTGEKPRWITVDSIGNIVNRSQNKEELTGLNIEIRRPCDMRTYTDDQLLNKLRLFEKKEGRTPKYDDFTNNPKYPNATTYVRRFGSWNKSLEKAFEIKRHKYDRELYTEEELLNELRRFEKESGKPPTGEDFASNPEYPSIRTYIRYFGSWSNALKFVELDTDTMVKKGILETNQQKARLAEIKVVNHFIKHPVDLAGENSTSPYDGICPNGMTYDVKSSKLCYEGRRYQFNTNNKYKEDIEIYFLLGFNKNWTKLDYGWRIPGEIAEKDYFHVGLNSSYEFNVENMKRYDITERLKEALKK